MTFVGAVLFITCFLGAILVLWLLTYVRRSAGQDRVAQSGGLDRMDDLRWKSWTSSVGWPPWTCWPGCRDLHREDWWRGYLHQNCWPGCQDLHREDWWRAYLDQTPTARG